MKRLWNFLVVAACCTGPSILAFVGSEGRAFAQKTSSVQVVNGPANPVPVRDVDNPTRTPFQSAMARDLIAAGANIAHFDFALPPGKVVAIEHVSVSADVPPGQQVSVKLYCQGSSGTGFPDLPVEAGYAEHSLVVTFQGTFGGNSRFVSSQAVKCYGFGPQGLRVNVERNGLAGATGNITAAVSGYLITP